MPRSRARRNGGSLRARRIYDVRNQDLVRAEHAMTAGRSNLVDITAKLVHQTDGAFLINDGKRKAWVPKSAVEDNGDGTFTMPESLAIEKDLV